MGKCIVKTLLLCTTTGSALLPLISCGIKQKDQISLELSGGSEKIVIDQTGSYCSGQSSKPWSVFLNGQEINPKNVIWRKVGDDDENILVKNGYIYWQNPKLVNHFFSNRSIISWSWY